MATLRVLGLPAPQGSKTRTRSGHMLDGATPEARRRHYDWRSAVAQAAADAAGETPLDGPLFLGVVFRFPMPTSRSRRLHDAGMVPKASAPDLDKLVRALCDGLVAGGLIRDDARIAELTASKVEVVGWTGAGVTIHHLSQEEP